MKLWSKPKIIFPLEIAEAKAYRIDDIPSVVMNESILILRIRKAFKAPIRAPVPKVIRHAAQMLIPPLMISQETSIELREITPPIERSNTPAARGAIKPRETTIRTASWFRIVLWVSVESHVSGTQIENNAKVAA